jgi:hypothetical protein
VLSLYLRFSCAHACCVHANFTLLYYVYYSNKYLMKKMFRLWSYLLNKCLIFFTQKQSLYYWGLFTEPLLSNTVFIHVSLLRFQNDVRVKLHREAIRNFILLHFWNKALHFTAFWNKAVHFTAFLKQSPAFDCFLKPCTSKYQLTAGIAGISPIYYDCMNGWDPASQLSVIRDINQLARNVN